ncbi:cation diffusion facilitator family transporter [Paracoccus sp. S3-43]|uniref:cation diffusion facilitator family transporter n=1 Tax=Paracoccus sp. S3-43 TaxID=3030011 RepID=UPI0023AFFEF2|nr:cation diffusion facilitator family transporter [Paracoccus sp. S3-43]WEF25623.1 cation diffusion facilitator family transporter [Paracoccus sp. S3-43]
MNRTLRIAMGSIAVGIAVLGLKTLAWRLTGSVALLSDALESTVNVATALAALIAIRIAQRPADPGHPYGHHKAEFLSAVLEGVMIIVAAMLILQEAYHGIRDPRPLDAPVLGLAVNALAGVMNAVWCGVLIRQGRRLKSPALLADGRHLLSDVVTSAGVILGVALAAATGHAILDPILAAVVAVHILWSGWKVMTASLGGLMDEAVSDDLLRDIRATIADHAEGAIEAHDLRTRHAGSMTFIDFHLVVDGDTPVAQAHAICDRIEAALKRKLDDAQITIHVEPEHKAKHSGVLVI